MRSPIPEQRSSTEAGWFLEERLWRLGATPLAGVDEAGRGALAGPVVAAAVILPFGRHPYRDSKLVSAGRRTEWSARIRSEAIAWGIGVAEPAEIDRLNILGATHLAAARALSALRVAPGGLVTDHLYLETRLPLLAPAKADRASLQVAAASILAKTHRDDLLTELDRSFPGYGLKQNKGYGTRDHLRALHDRGPTTAHRRSFRPVVQGGLFSP